MALTKKQLKIIDEWFKNGGDEIEISMKYGISYKQWVKWLGNKYFSDEVAGRLELAKRRSQILLARYIPLAAAKLVQLCNSENNETSRKACLDILALETGLKQVSDTLKSEAPEPAPTIDPATASKLLAALAETEAPQDQPEKEPDNEKLT
jgi:hypothetical protein